MMKKKMLWITLFFCGTIGLFGQTPPSQGRICRIYIEGSDTLAMIKLPTYLHLGYPSGKSKQDMKKYEKLVRNILKVYPYARIAAMKLQEYDVMLAKIPDKKERQKMMKEAEVQLRKEFSKQIEGLTFTQGIILLKLVDRETGKTTYKIVHELRGSFRAFFYQTIARLFKMDLKAQYDPNGTDKDIEKIVRMIEEGEI